MLSTDYCNEDPKDLESLEETVFSFLQSHRELRVCDFKVDYTHPVFEKLEDIKISSIEVIGTRTDKFFPPPHFFKKLSKVKTLREIIFTNDLTPQWSQIRDLFIGRRDQMIQVKGKFSVKDFNEVIEITKLNQNGSIFPEMRFNLSDYGIKEIEKIIDLGRSGIMWRNPSKKQIEYVFSKYKEEKSFFDRYEKLYPLKHVLKEKKNEFVAKTVGRGHFFFEKIFGEGELHKEAFEKNEYRAFLGSDKEYLSYLIRKCLKFECGIDSFKKMFEKIKVEEAPKIDERKFAEMDMVEALILYLEEYKDRVSPSLLDSLPRAFQYSDSHQKLALLRKKLLKLYPKRKESIDLIIGKDWKKISYEEALKLVKSQKTKVFRKQIYKLLSKYFDTTHFRGYAELRIHHNDRMYGTRRFTYPGRAYSVASYGSPVTKGDFTKLKYDLDEYRYEVDAAYFYRVEGNWFEISQGNNKLYIHEGYLNDFIPIEVHFKESMSYYNGDYVEFTKFEYSNKKIKARAKTLEPPCGEIEEEVDKRDIYEDLNKFSFSSRGC